MVLDVSIQDVVLVPVFSQQTAEVARLIVSDEKFKYFQLVANRHSPPRHGLAGRGQSARLDHYELDRQCTTVQRSEASEQTDRLCGKKYHYLSALEDLHDSMNSLH